MYLCAVLRRMSLVETYKIKYSQSVSVKFSGLFPLYCLSYRFRTLAPVLQNSSFFGLCFSYISLNNVSSIYSPESLPLNAFCCCLTIPRIILSGMPFQGLTFLMFRFLIKCITVWSQRDLSPQQVRSS